MKKILLIDDAEFARNIFKTILQKVGYNKFEEASNGRDGIEKFKTTKPDMVICDIIMDDMSGLDCVREILSIDSEANVVICSSISEKPFVDEALAIGAKSFIEKPVSTEKLRSIAERLIGKPTGGYKEEIESRAAQAGITGMPVLDFFEAFRQSSGFALDSPEIDNANLKKNEVKIVIGIRSLLSSKLQMNEIEKMLMILHEVFFA